MNATDTDTTSLDATCVNHSNRQTSVRCGKCGDPICTRCMVQTPVGMRCRECAGIRRLPQFDVSPALLVRAVAVGLAVSTVGWYLTVYAVFLRFFLGVLVGVAVGEAMTRMANRRTNRALQTGAVLAVVVGLVVVEVLRIGGVTPLINTLAQ